MSTENAVTPPPQIWPTLRAGDARKLIDFFVEAFGFIEVVAYTDDDGTIVHAELAWPLGGGLMMGQDCPVTPADGHWSLPPGAFGGYVVARDAAHVDEVFARAVAAGATPVREPYETDYGSHDAAVLDPEGNRWQFGTYPGEPVPR